jgi:hypothetical protein
MWVWIYMSPKLPNPLCEGPLGECLVPTNEHSMFPFLSFIIVNN